MMSCVPRLAVLTALMVGLIGGADTAGAVPAPGLSGRDGSATLQEFRTPGGAGWFYTLNTVEAANVVNQYRFAPSADPALAQLYTTMQAGRVEVRRLRLRQGGPSYLLSSDPQEFRDQSFADENVLGYIDPVPTASSSQRLLRFSNNGKWRVLPETAATIDQMAKEGYRPDRPLGWIRPVRP